MNHEPRDVPGAPLTYTGHRVIDKRGKQIGKVSDVVYDDSTPRWLVVDVGVLGMSHYAPAELTVRTDDGDVVAAFTKDAVKTAPKAHRNHILTRELDVWIADHYALSGHSGS